MQFNLVTTLKLITDGKFPTPRLTPRTETGLVSERGAVCKGGGEVSKRDADLFLQN